MQHLFPSPVSRYLGLSWLSGSASSRSRTTGWDWKTKWRISSTKKHKTQSCIIDLLKRSNRQLELVASMMLVGWFMTFELSPWLKVFVAEKLGGLGSFKSQILHHELANHLQIRWHCTVKNVQITHFFQWSLFAHFCTPPWSTDVYASKGLTIPVIRKAGAHGIECIIHIDPEIVTSNLRQKI